MANAEPKKIARSYAAKRFLVCAGLDPSGQETPESAAKRGECFSVRASTGMAVYSLEIGGGLAWIVCAAGSGEGMTEVGLAAIERQAKKSGCTRVGFQTLRRGLVRRAQRLGYSVTEINGGHQLTKDL